MSRDEGTHQTIDVALADQRAAIVAYLRSQSEIHRRDRNLSWAECLHGYAELIETQPERGAYVAAILSQYGVPPGVTPP